MGIENTRTTRQRRPGVKRRRKTKTGNRAKGSAIGAPPDSTTSDSAATQVDVAEVSTSLPAEKGGGAVDTVAKSPRRSSRRTAKSTRKKRRAVSASAQASDAQVVAEVKPADVPEPVEAPKQESPPAPDASMPEQKAARRRPARRRRRTEAEKGVTPKQGELKNREADADGTARPDPRLASPTAKAMDHPSAAEPEVPAAADGRGAREMLINVSTGDECRIAVLHEGRLEELFIEREATQSHVGNIYKGRITNVEPSIQAVFIDFGAPQNGFLHISDVQPQYFPEHTGKAEDIGRRIPRHSRPVIQKCFRRGQEVIVQVIKDGVGTKGPTLTTYLSIPGRFLVMMPGMSRHGVSRKIEDEADRRSMRDMLNQLDLPTDMGFILRTAGLDRSKRELQRDLNYLMRLWKTVVDRIKRLPAPAGLYQESDLVTRTIRDVYTADFKRLIVDDAETERKAREFLRIAMPRSKAVIELYTEREPLFHRYGIEDEIEKINMRHVPLRSGGSIIIDSTEALVAIDVNSGRFRTTEDAEETAFKLNIEAAEEIARQLRLRDLGGLIVCDFIDMRQDRHKRGVERALREALRNHKERFRLVKMSPFGLIEMTRQRQGPSLKRNIYFDCAHCKGTGLVKMPDSVLLDVMRIVQLATHHEQVQTVTVTAASDVAFRILNVKRAAINCIEDETGKKVAIRGDSRFTSDQVEYVCEDSRGRPVNIVPLLPGGSRTAR